MRVICELSVEKKLCSEFSVKIVDIEDNSKIILLSGHTSGVRTATWHSSGTLLATTGSDGKIIIWDVSQDPPKQDKVIDGVVPVVLDSEFVILSISPHILFSFFV